MSINADGHIKNCVCCGTEVNPDTDFDDEVSKREWFISALCQTCQGAFFVDEDEEDDDEADDSLADRQDWLDDLR